MKLSVIVPVFNEEKTVGEVMKRLSDLEIKDYEVVVVDDGSKDGTVSIVDSFQLTANSKVKKLRVIRHQKNLGKGAAIKTGLKMAKGEWVAIQDADLEYDPANIAKMIRYAELNDCAAVYGTRNRGIKNHYLYKHYYWGAKLIYFWINWLYGLKLSDPETCQKVIKREVLDFEIKETRFGVEVELTAKLARKGVKIGEMAIAYKPRSFAEGKKIRFKDGVRAVWAAWKYWW